MMSDIFKLLIDGELVDGDSSMEVIDPATGAPFQTVPRGSARQLDQAVAAAKAAQPAWAGLPIEERRGKLLVLADAVRANADGLARMLVREQGKPLPEARVEVAFTEGLIRYFASIDVRSEEHTSELQSLMRISYAVFCLKKKKIQSDTNTYAQHHQQQ